MTKSFLPAAALGALFVAASQGALAQPLGDTVTWTLSGPATGVKAGGRTTLALKGTVKTGWHVYGLKQLPTGPTPLVISLDKPAVAAAAGAPTGAAPKKFHDPSFDLETQYYEAPFTLSVPVRLGQRLPAGRQLIPISVRFQTCDGRICQPPKTLQLTAAVDVLASN